MSEDTFVQGQRMGDYLKLKQTIDEYRYLKLLLSIVRKSDENRSLSEEESDAARRAHSSGKKRFNKW